MQALLEYPPIIANIFHYYNNNIYEFLFIIEHILGRIDNNEYLTSRVLDAALMYSNIICGDFARSESILDENRLLHMALKCKSVKNLNFAFLDDYTSELVVINIPIETFSHGDKWFRAKIAPARFGDKVLDHMVVFRWDEETYVPAVKKLMVWGGVEAPLPSCLETLGINYEYISEVDIPRPLKNIILYSGKKNKLWWPGVTSIASTESAGKMFKDLNEILVIPADDLYTILKMRPEMQKTINTVVLDERRVKIGISSIKPGDIIPDITGDCIDFRNVTNRTIEKIDIVAYNERDIYLPSGDSLKYLYVGGCGKIHCEDQLNNLYSLDLDSIEQWDSFKKYAPNIRILYIRNIPAELEAPVIESDSVMKLSLYKFSTMPKLRCPLLRKVEIVNNNVGKMPGWYCIDDVFYRTYLKRAPQKLDNILPYKMCWNTYCVIEEDEYLRQYSKFKRAGLIIEESNAD